MFLHESFHGHLSIFILIVRRKKDRYMIPISGNPQPIRTVYYFSHNNFFIDASCEIFFTKLLFVKLIFFKKFLCEYHSQT